LPDFKPDVQNTGDIGFEQGRLTDRRKAPVSKTATSEESASEWVVSWRDERPVDLTFDFAKSFEINKVRIIYSEQLPQIEILISDDGRKWQSVVHSAKQVSTKDVCEYVQDGFVQAGRFVKIRFDARDPGCRMELAEVEIWSK
jgi:hypothetical protein